MGALGIADFVSRWQNELQSRPIQLAFQVEQGIAKAQADITRSFSTFKARFNVQPIESLTGTKLESPDQAARALTDLTKKASELRAEYDKSVATQKGAANTIVSSYTATEDSINRITVRATLPACITASLSALWSVSLFAFNCPTKSKTVFSTS